MQPLIFQCVRHVFSKYHCVIVITCTKITASEKYHFFKVVH